MYSLPFLNQLKIVYYPKNALSLRNTLSYWEAYRTTLKKCAMANQHVHTSLTKLYYCRWCDHGDRERYIHKFPNMLMRKGSKNLEAT